MIYRTRTAIASLIAAAGIANAGGIPAMNVDLIIAEGDIIDGSPVDIINAPFTNSLGEIGMLGALDDGRRFVWVEDAPIFFNTDIMPEALTGGEGTMGIGDAGQFIYSPSVDGDDSVWGESGLIATENVQAPDFPAGINSTFHSRPRMLPDGSSFWISGFNDGMGGTSSIGRMLYYRDGGTGVITAALRAGDVIDGLTVAAGSGVDFDCTFSEDGANTAFVFNNVEAIDSTVDGTVAINGDVVAQEGSPTGGGDNWDNFDAIEINNAGNAVFSGDTDGDSSTDEFIAFNDGIIALRQGDTVDGLTFSGSVDALSINQFDSIAFIIDTAEETETLFFNTDFSNADDAVKVISVGDPIDTTGDGLADWIVDDFNASVGIGPGLHLAEDGRVAVEVDIESLDGMTNIEAIIAIDLPNCSRADLAAPLGVLDFNDVVLFLEAFSVGSPAADFAAPFGVLDFNDVVEYLTQFSAGCP